MDDNKYLKPGFDPEKLTMPQLRNIFVAHDVAYPSSARKADLVNIFKEEVAPRSAELLAKAQAVEPTSSGIVDVASSSGSRKSTKHSESPSKAKARASTASKVTTSSQSPRKSSRSKRVKSETDDDEDGHVKKIAKVSDLKPVKSSVEPSVEPEEKLDFGPSVSPSPRKRSRKTAVRDPNSVDEFESNLVKNTAPVTLAGSKTSLQEDEESRRTSFSPLNYFQTASTPIKNKKRHSTDPQSSEKKKKKRATEVKQEAAQEDISNDTADFSTPEAHRQAQSPSTGSQSLPKLKSAMKQSDFSAPSTDGKRKSRLSFMPDINNLKTSKEFAEVLKNSDTPKRESRKSHRDMTVPESQISDIIKESPKAPKTKAKPSSKSSKKLVKRKEGHFWKKTFAFLYRAVSLLFKFSLIGSVLVYAAWWRKERFEIGYCDVSFAESTRDASPYDEVLDYIRPVCVKCPEHAQCAPNFVTVCDDSYILVENPFSFGGLMPLAPSCIPDTEKKRRVTILQKKVLEILRDRNAEAECGESDAGAAISLGELHKIVYDLKAATLSDSEFEDLWAHALEEINEEDEIIVRQDH